MSAILENCRLLIEAYKTGKLGQTKMPEDTSPGFTSKEKESQLAYFTLPMALNYQRNSYSLWEAALKTYNDPETRVVFNISKVVSMDENKLREYLTRYKLALQPNKHIQTWKSICLTVFNNFGTFEGMFKRAENDFVKLRGLVQGKNKKGFLYLSGPKIFNYWSFIIQKYGGINLKNSEFIEIAPDTHITQCSVKLGVITQGESETLSKEEIAKRWREILKNTELNPIDMHSPLWFWSRNGFIYSLP